MAKRKKNKSKDKQNSNKQTSNKGLFGTNPVMEHPIAQTVTKGGLVLLAAIAAGGAGAALGKHSLLAGIPVTLVGFHKKNPYLIAAGLGLTLSNGFQKNQAQNQSKTTTVQGVEGFDMKQIAEEAKDRVGTFFKNFAEKLYIKPAAPTATAGLAGEHTEEPVTYFVNPYHQAKEKELDMTAIDRIQEEIAQMQGSVSGMDDMEREF